MANHCGNYLRVSGEEKDMEHFISFLKEKDGRLQFDLCELSGVEGRVYDTLVSHDTDSKCLDFSYSTAWAPQTQCLIALSSKFPKLMFQNQYEEGGCCFVGMGTYVNGSESDECYDDALTYCYNERDEFAGCVEELQELVDKTLSGDTESRDKLTSYVTDEFGEPDEDGDYDEWWQRSFKEEVWDKVAPIIVLSKTKFEDFPLLVGDLSGHELFQKCMDAGKNVIEEGMKDTTWNIIEKLGINVLEFE